MHVIVAKTFVINFRFSSLDLQHENTGYVTLVCSV